MLRLSGKLLSDIKDEAVSALHLAYLVKVGVVAAPLAYTDDRGIVTHIFDDGHLEDCKRAKTVWNQLRPSEIKSEQAACELDVKQLGTGYSDSVRAKLEISKGYQQNLLRKKKYDLQDFFSPQKPWYLRLLRKVKPFRLRISLKEGLNLATTVTVAQSMLFAKFVAFVSDRLRVFEPHSEHDRCLRLLIEKGYLLGWDMFYHELDVVQDFIREHPDLLQCTICEGLNFISDLEKDYIGVKRVAYEYVDQVDPERLIWKRLLYDQILPKFNQVISAALSRSDERFQDSLRKLAPQLEEMKDIIEERFKQFLLS